MTPDEAIAVRVRLDTAIMSLHEAYRQIPRPLKDDDETGADVLESLEEAIQAAESALAQTKTIIGV